MRRVYLDHTATTPLDPRVLEVMRPYFGGVFGNASSIHSFGRDAKQALEGARASIASLLGADPGEVFFTSGGTEANNLAIFGTTQAAAGHGRTKVVSSQTEHHAVLEPIEVLSGQGRDAVLLPVDSFGTVDLGRLQEEADGKTALVSIMHANNEVGTIGLVREAAEIAHAAGALMHSDAVQSAGKIPVDVRELGVDLLTVSAHKMYGPKGIGALYVKRGTEISPVLHGGGQERGRRPGTENVPLVVGFAEAFRLAVLEREEEMRRVGALRDALEARIRSALPAAIVNGHPSRRLPTILSISIDNTKLALEGEMLVIQMDLHGVAATSGSACSSGSMQPSHVLLAMGRDVATARATLRFSFGRSNTEADIDYVAESLQEVITAMQKH